MTDSRIHQLLEDLMESGRTPEEVCHAHPELLLEVQERWRRIQLLVEEAEVAFPAERDDEANLEGLNPPHRWGERPKVTGYDILEVLGRGGMGVVYKARHHRLNRVVALKMLRCGDFAAPKELASLVREAQSIAELKNPNIVQVHDVGELDTLPYFTMEFVEGGSLAQKLSGEPQPAMNSAEWVSVLARAVHAAHDRGIVHRDLKPGNILVSADGTLKITDFGLARRFGNDETAASVAARVGTPSYMPPEQALGTPAAIEPTADIYSLGAILYEMLTGRPPFRGESPAETERQVISDEPVPPQRLNPRTPRDLQTICLKCLQKSPERRYRSARELADDLDRFRRGEPIRARRVGRTERVLRWARRKPTAATLLVTTAALVGLASGGGAWFVQQRAERRAETARLEGRASRTAEARLEQAAALQKQGRWREARTALDVASVVLEAPSQAGLRDRLRQASADLHLAERLDAARIRAWTLVVVDRSHPASSDPLFAAAFAEAGLAPEGDDVETVAARVRRSAVRAEIVAALDAWAGLTHDASRREWLLAVARKADPDPVRDQLRDPEVWQDGARLTELAEHLSETEVPSQLATTLGRVALLQGARVVPLLRAAQARFPQDFWLNFELGSALLAANRPEEAVGFCRAALALRPDTSEVHCNLGLALYDTSRDEAIGHYRQALRIDPESAVAHLNLGSALRDQGLRDEALQHLEQVLRLEPDSCSALLTLGLCLRDAGRLDEAMVHLQRAVHIHPGSSAAHINLGSVLFEQRRSDEALDHLRQGIRIDPQSTAGHINLGAALWDTGRLDEAIDHFQEALRIDPAAEAAQSRLRTSLYPAARADIRAATAEDAGTVGGGDPPDGSGSAEQRRRALARLRAALELASDGGALDLSLPDWQTHPDLATVRDPEALARLPDAEREEWLRLWADVAAVIAADPLAQAQRYVAHRQWAQASECYARCLTRNPTDRGHFWYEYAAVLLLAEDYAGYAQACDHLIQGCGTPGGPRAYHVARACTLAEGAAPDPSVLARLAENELQRFGTQFWSLTEQGALAYRAGRFEESASFFERSLEVDATPGRAVLNWLWLALANEQLGKTEEARRWLDTATAWLGQFRGGMPSRAEEELGLHLHNWLEAHILLREAEAAIIPN